MLGLVDQGRRPQRDNENICPFALAWRPWPGGLGWLGGLGWPPFLHLLIQAEEKIVPDLTYYFKIDSLEVEIQ